jgi:hypothetical protein
MLLNFTPARAPADGLDVTEAQLIDSLAEAGVATSAAKWTSVLSYVGGKGGIDPAVASIAIAFAITVAYKFTGSFADAMGKDGYASLKMALSALARRGESQVRESTIEVTIEMGDERWALVTVNPSEIGQALEPLGNLQVSLESGAPAVWVIRFDGSEWSVTALPFQAESPPTLRG